CACDYCQYGYRFGLLTCLKARRDPTVEITARAWGGSPRRILLTYERRYTSGGPGICAQPEHSAEIRTFVRIRAHAHRGTIRDDLARAQGRVGRERGQRLASRRVRESDFARRRATRCGRG